MRYKCFQCLKPGHSFKNCSEATCACPCVSELFKLPVNPHEDELLSGSPNFLKINDDEIPNLLYPYKQMNDFMRIRTNEQDKELV